MRNGEIQATHFMEQVTDEFFAEKSIVGKKLHIAGYARNGI